MRSLVHRYEAKNAPVAVLEGLDLDLDPGEFVALSGPSGAGKSTLLALLGGLQRPQGGVLMVAGLDLASLAARQLAYYRRSTVGFVFQHFGLLEALTARENVELALNLAGCPRSKRRSEAGALLDSVGLADRATHRPGALSGGERQRVAIARALAGGPRLLLADEPTGSLDSSAADTVLDLLEALSREHGCTLLVVTHQREVAARAGRRLVLDGGQVTAA
ncbi:MAG: ABC transporter ATP-binding protein [Acidimicrobiia bacterium]